MKIQRYSLQKYRGRSTRFDCPKCGKQKTFTRYIDNTNGQHLGDEVGRCNREGQCGYHYPPKEFFENGGTKPDGLFAEVRYQPPKEPNYLPDEMINTNYQRNNLYSFLINYFDRTLVDEVMYRYKVGSSSKWIGATVFYQIDKYGRYRTGKIMQYSARTGKRVKEPYNKISWLHYDYPDYELRQCMFGEHLIKGMDKTPLCIVESEKTALIMAVKEPDYIWLATGGLSNLNRKRLQLGHRFITLFPDAGCADKWEAKVKGMCNVNVCKDFDNEPEGTDLADMVLSEVIEQQRTP